MKIEGSAKYMSIKTFLWIEDRKDKDCLSAGCKTVLNVLYYPDKVFCLKECGNNALQILYDLKKGYVYSDYALIPLDMDSVVVQTKTDKKIVKDYEELKEWWENEE